MKHLGEIILKLGQEEVPFKYFLILALATIFKWSKNSLGNFGNFLKGHK